MKIRNVLIHLLAGLTSATGAVWGIVEGLDYFVNEDPTNWLFLIPLISGIAGAIVNYIVILKD